MKRAVYLMIGIMLFAGNIIWGKHADKGRSNLRTDSVSIFASPDLLKLSATWAEEYNRLFPGANIKVISVADQKGVQSMMQEGNIGFTSGAYIPALKNGSLWSVVVGRDVIVPVFNAKNPFLEEIAAHGISPAVLSGFFSNSTVSWGTLLKNGRQEKAELFCPGDEPTLKSVAAFLHTDEGKILAGKTAGTADVLAAVEKDPLALGFCKLADVIDPSTQQLFAGIRLLPVDRNGNGTMDFNEKIYDNVSDFSRGVWIGKYPRALVSNIYTVASAQPENSAQVGFIKWVIADGQKFLEGNGFTDLLASERQSAADRLYTASAPQVASSGGNYLIEYLLFIIATVILIGWIATSLARQRKRKKAVVRIEGSLEHPVLDQNSLRIPKGIYFDKTHTWAFMEESGTVKVGIDDFLQHVTGKITRIKMKETGKKVKKGEQILSIIQNGKQLSLYAPVSGTIVEQNTLLEGNAAYLNSSPYASGWIYRIEPSNWSRESQLLFMADKQREFLKKEFTRLKDFLMKALLGDPDYAQFILQDGGEIADGVLSEMGPEVWEDFQTSFIDPSRQVWFYEIF
jgi:glycine cleavage system H lipoate-binding protein/ABC-type phosphate transport system substrate-binding protein